MRKTEGTLTSTGPVACAKVLASDLQPLSTIWAPLAHRGFLWFIFATFLYHLGIWCFVISVSWQITTLSPSATVTALIQTALNLPVLLFVFPAGALVDRGSHKAYLLVALSTSAIVVTIGALASHRSLSSYEDVILLTLTSATTFALAMPAWNSWATALVNPNEIMSAVVLMGLSHSIMRAVGYLLGGLVIARFGIAAGLWLAGAFLFSALTVFTMTPNPKNAAECVKAFSVKQRLNTSSRFIWKLCCAAGILSAGISAVWSLLPAVLAASPVAPTKFCLIMSCFGLGAMVGIGVVELWRTYFSVRRTLLLASCLLGCMTALVPISGVNMWLSLVVVFLGGSWTISNALLLGACLHAAGHTKRASVAGHYLSFSYAGVVTGSLLFGGIAGYLNGFRLVFCCAACVIILGALAIAAIPALSWKETEDCEMALNTEE